MSSSAPSMKNQALCDLLAFDQIFLGIFNDLVKDALIGTREGTEAIFKLSSSYIEKPAFESLKRFSDLYFGSEEIEKSKQRIAQEVGDLVEALQAKLDAGENLDTVVIEEKYGTERLGLAGVQKQIEGLITLDAGLKSRILPALTSMQFEDAVNQRLDHILLAWQSFANFFEKQGSFGDDMQSIARDLAQICSSVDESALYYREVLREEPPVDLEDRGIFLEF